MLSLNNVGVYLDSNTCLYHVDNLKSYGLHFQNCFVESAQLDYYISSSLDKKYAVFHVPFFKGSDWLDKFHRVYHISDHVFVFCSELHQHTVDQLISLDKPNVTLCICGFINYNFTQAKVHTWMDWFITTVYFYNTVQPNLLNTKLGTTAKSKCFDILLGCRRPHRDFIFQYIHDNNLLDQVIMTYYQRWNVDLRQTDHIFETEGLEFLPESNLTHSVHQIKYYGHKMNLSQVVPLIIYNDSCYSIVAETNASNQFNFYTEKIVKPILGRRLFVVIAGQGYLKNLQSLGFRTFNEVIDESYDNEVDDQTRWRMAMDQVRYLTVQDPEEIQAKIKDVVEHNQRLMLEHNWYQDFTNSLITTLADIIAR